MFNLFRSIGQLFADDKAQVTVHDTGYELDEAIEQVIDGIDPRLKLVPGYQKKLRPAVSRSLTHIATLVDQVPGPIDVSRRTFISDPEVRAYFSTPDVLQDTFSCGSELKDFFSRLENSDLDSCCALLCANREEKQGVGSALEGDMIRRDVLQTSINFFDYKVLSPAVDDGEVRRGIKRCIFDGLVSYSLHHIASIKSEREELINQRRMLHARLRSRQASGNGLTKLLAEAHFEALDSEGIETKLQQTEEKLDGITGDSDVFSFYLDEISKLMSRPEDFIQLRSICVHLNDMGIKVLDETDGSANRVCFSELEISDVMKRVVTIIRYHKQEIDCIKSQL